MTKRTNSWPVIMYPEGVRVGRVNSGKDSAGKIRHIAFDTEGARVGTFPDLTEAQAALCQHARANQ